jgi:hypothetical protein
MSPLDPIEMRRIAIRAASNRHGIFCPVPELQAECMIMGHKFADMRPSRNDPLGVRGVVQDSCIYCGWKE